MSTVNQLLAKAMSTDSDDEAVSCLRMARKKGKAFDQPQTNDSLYSGRSAYQWFEVSKAYYLRNKELTEALAKKSQPATDQLHATMYWKGEYERYYKKYLEERDAKLSSNSKLMIMQIFSSVMIIGLTIALIASNA